MGEELLEGRRWHSYRVREVRGTGKCSWQQTQVLPWHPLRGGWKRVWRELGCWGRVWGDWACTHRVQERRLEEGGK